jgi:hypothetical protein
MKFGEVATVIFLTNQIIHHESHESVALREKTKGVETIRRWISW